ncbi:hypothetical protein ACFLSG_00775, partial [Candidatus Bipolaricaulota bacterium]
MARPQEGLEAPSDRCLHWGHPVSNEAPDVNLEPLRDLGLSEPLRAALLKLTAAIPESRQAARSRIAERILIDSAPWSRRTEPNDHLSVLHDAAMEDRWVRVDFDRPF